jgi:hypothetical protein
MPRERIPAERLNSLSFANLAFYGEPLSLAVGDASKFKHPRTPANTAAFLDNAGSYFSFLRGAAGVPAPVSLG